jgi:hypothetical protein
MFEGGQILKWNGLVIGRQFEYADPSDAMNELGRPRRNVVGQRFRHEEVRRLRLSFGSQPQR